MQAPIVNTPLGLIALFVAVIELFLAFPVTKLNGDERMIMVIFMVTFPFFVAGMFFYVLWYRPLHLYAPQDIPADLQQRVQEKSATVAALELRISELEADNASLRKRITAPEAAVLSPVRAAEFAPVGVETEVKQLANEVQAAIGTSKVADDDAIARAKDEVGRRRSVNKKEQRDRITKTMKEFREWLEGIGFKDLPPPLKVVIEPASELNSYYVSGENAIHIGALVVDDVDATTHTYFHAVIDRYGVLSDSMIANDDTLAVIEAYCDYFACSYTDDPRFGESFAAVLAKQGYPLKGALRDLSEVMTLKEAPLEPHERSRVWSGACWQIRTELGQAKTDALLRDALPKMPARAEFAAAAKIVYDEAKSSGGAKAAKIVQSAFEAREVL